MTLPVLQVGNEKRLNHLSKFCVQIWDVKISMALFWQKVSFFILYNGTLIHMRAPADILFSDWCEICFWNEHFYQWSFHLYRAGVKIKLLNVTVLQFWGFISTLRAAIFSLSLNSTCSRNLEIYFNHKRCGDVKFLKEIKSKLFFNLAI